MNGLLIISSYLHLSVCRGAGKCVDSVGAREAGCFIERWPYTVGAGCFRQVAALHRCYPLGPCSCCLSGTACQEAPQTASVIDNCLICTHT